MKTDSNGQIQRAPRGNQETLVELVRKMHGPIASVLPKHITAERMARIVTTALRVNPALADCSTISFASAVMACSFLGLEPNTPLGLAYLIPFKKRGVPECQLIIGYQGEMELARRSGQVASIQAFPVFQGDDYSCMLGTSPSIHHVPSDAPDREEPRKLIRSYAVVRLKAQGTDPIFESLSRQQIEQYRKRGASGRGVSTPWDTDYVSMALKTAIRRVFRWAPKSSEYAVAAEIERREDTGLSIAPALPEELTRALLTSGAATEEQLSDETAEQLPAEREIGEEG